MIRRDWQQVEQTLLEHLLSNSEAASSLRISLDAKILPSKRFFQKFYFFSFFGGDNCLKRLSCSSSWFPFAESPIYLRRFGVGM